MLSSFHDALTGLSNRALLSDRAAQALARARREGGEVAVLMINLDAFKLVNAAYGRARGDELLRAVAERLATAARAGDTVARLGADEFVVLAERVGAAEQALALAERMRAAVKDSGAGERLSASIGVALGAIVSFEELLGQADVAMRAAKLAGKDVVALFEETMYLQVSERLRTQVDLGEALRRGDLSVLYQPEFELTGGRLAGFKATVRLRHTDGGLIAGEQLAALAQKSELTLALGRWLLGQALTQAITWRSDDRRPLSVAVGLSSLQLHSASLPADVQEALAHSTIDPWRVVLEVGESSLPEGGGQVDPVLHALKQLGVRLAIDDFGAGSRSPEYVRDMPVDLLKLAPVLVRRQQEGEYGDDQQLEASIDVARSLSLRTLAKGIEHPGLLAAAHQLGCDLAQGYLLGGPLPAEQVQRLIDDVAGAHSG